MFANLEPVSAATGGIEIANACNNTHFVCGGNRLGYINVPSLKQHEANLGTDIVFLNRGQMTRMTPELAHPSPNSRATPTGDHLATMYDLACSRPHTWRIFGGIGFRFWDPPVQWSRPYH
ncbi:hypothetical protein AVEN_54686-1 [Araneus ventricosus]|uniref:Uncharacterized protein n=1 Tax=Araneus ventricosus TaxID=182803 RepID=A0A4Y2QFT1_ARAVE|nr:hypothetical protein AVEN_54686-1 [Araneus ventricosus]